MSDLITVNSKNVVPRLVLGIIILSIVLLGWFSIRWQIGNLLATITTSTDPNSTDIATAAAGLAPGDPAAGLLVAATTNDPAEAIKHYEDAIRLAPNDYRWRVELARIYAQNDMSERAEAEFGRAVELAPNYASPRWHRGNFFLRQGRGDEAVAELKKAAAHNQAYRDQVFSLAWDYFQKEPARLEEMVVEPAARAHLAYFLAARGAAEAALRTWNSLSSDEKHRYNYRAILIADGLYGQRHFAEALGFAKQLGMAADVEPERITNPSFESTLGNAEASRFAWQVYRTESKVEITPDGKVQHDGSRSLRVSFRGFSKPVLANVFQTVVVQPDMKYRMSFWLKTDGLKSTGMPAIEVLNGVDERSIVISEPFSAGTAEWQKISLEFTTPPGCDGIIIRTIRLNCGEDCPITGTFWYDDFELAKL
ncbi:MAG: tetratricopeptide repeat protein [Pyrinomonadaceae bacterium]